MRTLVNPRLRLRSGSLNVPIPAAAAGTPIAAAAAALRNAAVRCRDELDRIGHTATGGATITEQRRAAAQLFEAMKGLAGIAQRSVTEARQFVETKLAAIDNVVRHLEGRESPLAVARLAREADELAKLPVTERGDRFAAAERAKDLTQLLAFSLVAGNGDSARRAMARISRPAEMEELSALVPALLAVVEGEQQLAGGLVLLGSETEPWAEKHRLTGADLIALGNNSDAVFTEHVPVTWPRYLQPTATQPANPQLQQGKPDAKPAPQPKPAQPPQPAAAEVPQEHAAGGWPAAV